MALTNAFLDELRARTQLVAIVARRVRLHRNGRQWKGCCPFHNEKTPSFYVYDDHFHCFGCGAHGDAITFVMRTEGAAFSEAVERLAAEAGLVVPRTTGAAAVRETQARDLHAVLAAAAEAFRDRLGRPEGRAAMDYLQRRGLTEDMIDRFGLGWSGEGRGAIASDLRGAGITPEQLAAAGLMKPRVPEDPNGGLVDLFFNRIMFPIRDRRGRVISFGGRVIGEGQPKYMNGPETILFQKRRSLYGVDLARDGVFRGATLVVTEGYMDVIALHQAGFAGALAPLGTALTQEQLQALWEIGPEPVLCFDGDAAGSRAAARAAELALPLISPARSLRMATLPAGEDPDTFVARHGAAGFRATLDAARGLEDCILGFARERTGDRTPVQRAALRDEALRLCGQISHRGLAAQIRSHVLAAFGQRYFARGRRSAPAAVVQRRPVDPAAPRLERARNLLAILLRHPSLLPEVEEVLTALDLPPGRCATLRDAMLEWLGASVALDSSSLMAQLQEHGLGESVNWATRRDGLSGGALSSAQPKEALDEFWHFFGLLRGEAALIADRAEAERLLAATNDPTAQRRLIYLSEAIAQLRGGEGAEAEPDP
jgi:DNA primase